MSKHTPGPWVVEDGRKMKSKTLRSEMLMVVAEAGGMPGLIVNSGKVMPTDEANARLIAAAPELLAVCEQLLARVCKECADPDDLPEVFQARAAIKKARGE